MNAAFRVFTKVICRFLKNQDVHVPMSFKFLITPSKIHRIHRQDSECVGWPEIWHWEDDRLQTLSSEKKAQRWIIVRGTIRDHSIHCLRSSWWTWGLTGRLFWREPICSDPARLPEILLAVGLGDTSPTFQVPARFQSIDRTILIRIRHSSPDLKNELVDENALKNWFQTEISAAISISWEVRSIGRSDSVQSGVIYDPRSIYSRARYHCQ
jgi:hypothetical protein